MKKREEQLLEIDWNNNEQIKTFYENNSLYYNNFKHIEGNDKIYDFVNIKLFYARSLFDNSSFDKALTILEEVKYLLDMLDNEYPNFNNAETFYRYLKGMIYGNKKEFKESYKIFSKLVKEDPEHHYYKIWYNHSKLGLYQWIFNAVSIIGMILVFIDLFGEDLEDKIGIDIGIIGLIMLAISYLTLVGLKSYFKNKKTVSNSSHK